MLRGRTLVCAVSQPPAVSLPDPPSQLPCPPLSSRPGWARPRSSALRDHVQSCDRWVHTLDTHSKRIWPNSQTRRYTQPQGGPKTQRAQHGASDAASPARPRSPKTLVPVP